MPKKMSTFENFIAVSRYARWLPEESRRETWEETVDRYMDFMFIHLLDTYDYDPTSPVFDEVRQAIVDREVMPSMRALMTAGAALERNHVSGLNCSFAGVNNPRVFDEAVFILMSGTGFGFSVEERHVSQLPPVPEKFVPARDVIVVEDSKEGWADAYRQVIDHLFSGRVPKWDVSKVRPSGARLKTFGGRASGPDPLVDLFNFTIDVFTRAAGRKLEPLEVHDVMCKVGEIVVSGGVRRSALISLSDLDNFDMAGAKSGRWWEHNGQRALANNSATYYSKPTATHFMREWLTLAESGSGERGIFNIGGARKHVEASGLGRDASRIAGTNPCSEILLRDAEFCNLTEVVIRDTDTVEDVQRKVRIASIMGTWQASLTDFPYLRGIWRENMEEEALLGVSLTGIYGHELFNNPDDPALADRLSGLREAAREANAEEAARLGINSSAAITCVKPSGTASLLAGVSSGIHPWHAPFYIRRVRGAKSDPLSVLMMEAGVPHEDDVMNDRNVVFSFPMKAPDGAVHSGDITAIDHLRLYLVYREFWADHAVSITVSVKDEEWPSVGAWVYDHFDQITGVSFLPSGDGHTYKQTPYEEIDVDAYDELVAQSPTDIRFADLAFYESEDGTTGSQTLACGAGGCEVADLTEEETAQPPAAESGSEPGEEPV